MLPESEISAKRIVSSLWINSDELVEKMLADFMLHLWPLLLLLQHD